MTLGTEPERRPLRADAARNRQRILEAAEDTFAREGLAVPVDVVAERAGVGVGTVYRHFPTKEALFEAIVVERLDALLQAAAADSDPDATSALFRFLSTMAEQVSLKRDLFDALGAAGIDVKSRCAGMFEELEATVERLRQRAVETGGVRGDVSTSQIIGLVAGACMGADRVQAADARAPAPQCQRMVDVICDGLRAKT